MRGWLRQFQRGVSWTCGYRSMCWRSPFDAADLNGRRWVKWRSRRSSFSWNAMLIALVRLQPGERARFPCGEIPAAVPDGLSVPVVRSGNTGKSRFLEASLPVAVPNPFQDPARSVPRRGDLLQLRFNRIPAAEFVGPHRRGAGRDMCGYGNGDTTRGRSAMEIIRRILLGAALGGIATWLLVGAAVPHRGQRAARRSGRRTHRSAESSMATLTMGRPWSSPWSHRLGLPSRSASHGGAAPQIR